MSLQVVALVARALIVEQDHILLYQPPDYAFTTLPGGPLVIGESALVRLTRYCAASMGIDVQIDGFVGCVENVWNLTGEPYHEVASIFRVSSPVLSPNFAISHHCWIPLNQLKAASMQPHYFSDLIPQWAKKPPQSYWFANVPEGLL
jgi:hypothetical protein